MALFNYGSFTLHSGQESNFLIDCDALTDEDLEALMEMAMQRLSWNSIFAIKKVIGIPRGGLRFAQKFEKYISDKSEYTLVVDDVMTTGSSMKKVMEENPNSIGVVIFLRDSNQRIMNVFPLFMMN